MKVTFLPATGGDGCPHIRLSVDSTTTIVRPAREGDKEQHPAEWAAFEAEHPADRDAAAPDGSDEPTFVDRAELIWRRLADGATHATVAEELGLRQDRIGHFAMLRKLPDQAWTAVVASVRAAPQTSPFTERLLRDASALAPEVQTDLVRKLAAGEITKGAFRKEVRRLREARSSKSVAAG